MVVNADMDEIPASAPALLRAARVAGDAVANTLETPELFDIDVNDLAWALALIAASGSAGSRSRIRLIPAGAGCG